jgi:hypothetical protein
MMTRGVPALACAAALFASAGCGGDDEPTVYRLMPTSACLRSANVPVTTRNLDFVATTALGGALRARFPSNQVVVAFGSSPNDGDAIERAYEQFAGRNIGLQDVLMREQNVVLVWAAKPSEQDLARVADCLEG